VAHARGMAETRKAAVLTVSDGVHARMREDRSGPAVRKLLERDGYAVEQRVVPDESDEIQAVLRDLAGGVALIVTTGGTGFGPRDVTPEATRAVIEREAPGLAEAMRAAGRARTALADMSRGVAGTLGATLIVNLPGSPKGATENLEAIIGILPHALEHLSGETEHR